MEAALDCRHYIGDRPCKFKARCKCENYVPQGFRVAIIKLGALGDVARTASLADTVKRMYRRSHVTWISKPSGVRILAGHPSIDRLVEFSAINNMTLAAESFDLVLSLDKEPQPAALCKMLDAPDKRGMSLSRFGTVYPVNPACENYFELGLDDDLKFNHNRLSYPQLIHDALELPYIRQPYRLFAGESDFAWADAIFAEMTAAGRTIVGLNTGSGAVFANKAPSMARWQEIAQELLANNYSVALLGGPDEDNDNRRLLHELNAPVDRVIYCGGDNSERQFTAIVDRCDAIVTGDTLAMHVGVARRKGVVALFGPTCHQEIDLFDRGIKLVSPARCGPCYSRSCDKSCSCMDQLSVENIVNAVKAVVKNLKLTSDKFDPTKDAMAVSQ